MTPQSDPLKLYARLSPVAIHINETSVEIWVFDPENWERDPLIIADQ